MKIRNLIITMTAVGLAAMLNACTGRTADNMVPTGETVEVVIPAPDVTADSVIANGNIDI